MPTPDFGRLTREETIETLKGCLDVLPLGVVASTLTEHYDEEDFEKLLEEMGVDVDEGE